MDKDDENTDSSRRRKRKRRAGQSRGRAASKQQDLERILASADERTRRLVVGFLAKEFGRGGIAHFARVTGISRETIRRGQFELRQTGALAAGRVRRPGAGRKRIEIKFPGC